MLSQHAIEISYNSEVLYIVCRTSRVLLYADSAYFIYIVHV